jgi:hypothetical protein
VSGLSDSPELFDRHPFLHVAGDATPEQLSTLADALDHPCAWPDAAFAPLLRMVPSTESSLRPSVSVGQLYLFTQPITLRLLRDFIEYAKGRRVVSAELDCWELEARHVRRRFLDKATAEARGAMRDELEDSADNECLYLRYAGQLTRPGMTVFKRMQEEGRAGVFQLLLDFKSMHQEAFQELVDVVYLLPDAPVSPLRPSDPPPQDLVDDSERILIHLLNRSSLLNQQAGGHFTDYCPTFMDATIISGLKIHVHANASLQLALSGPPPQPLCDRLQVWDDKRWAWAAARSKFASPSSATKLTSLDQALPCLYFGHTLTVILGRDITREEYQSGGRFLGGSSRASGVFTSNEAYLAAWERNRSSPEHAADRLTGQPKLPSPILFPCLDLAFQPDVHIAKSPDLQGHIDIVSSYLRIVRLLIVATLGHLVSSVASANFLHSRGLPSNDFFTHAQLGHLKRWAG